MWIKGEGGVGGGIGEEESESESGELEESEREREEERRFSEEERLGVRPRRSLSDIYRNWAPANICWLLLLLLYAVWCVVFIVVVPLLH